MKQPSKAQALGKLVSTKNYIVVTDTDAYMKVDVNLDSIDFDDVLRLSAQRGTLEMFKQQLDGAIKEYDRRLDKGARTKNKSKKAKKIPVKEA